MLGNTIMVQFSGHFDGRVITPEEPVEIPVNTPPVINIEPAPGQTAEVVDWARLLDLANECAVQGPADLAERHDHYATGDALTADHHFEQAGFRALMREA